MTCLSTLNKDVDIFNMFDRIVFETRKCRRDDLSIITVPFCFVIRFLRRREACSKGFRPISLSRGFPEYHHWDLYIHVNKVLRSVGQSTNRISILAMQVTVKIFTGRFAVIYSCEDNDRLPPVLLCKTDISRDGVSLLSFAFC